MKLLFNTPNWKRPELGGVANHYYGLKPYWTETVVYNIVGSRYHPNTGKYWFIWDIIKTTLKILVFNPDVVIVNTSLGRNALRRDSIFLNLAHRLGKKTIVFFHGFNFNYASGIDQAWFLNLFKNSDGYFVLSNSIKQCLDEWGVKQPVLLTTTKVDDRLITDFDVSKRDGHINNILYLGRVEKEKGIFIALDIFRSLQTDHPNLSFTIVGSGTQLDNAKNYANRINLHNIQFTGALTGNELMHQYEKADIYVFTSYHEGMPTSVLEAMCFGLPIITRPVGGLVDFFEDGKMGYMIDSFDACDFIPSIESLLNNIKDVRSISEFNHQYGKEHFLASKVARNIEELIREICY